MHDYTEQYKKIIMSIILKHMPQVKVILYGSRARKDAHQGSDIDIALDMVCAIDDSIMTAILGDLEDSNLPIAFDVVDFHRLSEQMRQEILKDGVVWHK